MRRDLGIFTAGLAAVLIAAVVYVPFTVARRGGVAWLFCLALSVGFIALAVLEGAA